MPLPLLALALAVTSPPRTYRYHVPGWTVTVHSDPFASARSCEVEGRRIRLQGPIVWFDLGHAARTQDVVYRIDSGPPQDLGTAHLDPLRLSQDEALNNPSGGEVGLHAALLTGARFVWIRADEAKRPVRFDVSRLPQAVGLATRLDCPLGANDAPAP